MERRPEPGLRGESYRSKEAVRDGNHRGGGTVSDTLRTDAAEYESQDEPVAKLGAVDVDFARQLERELNAATSEIEEKRKDVVWLATEKAKLDNYVMRLEEAGDALANNHNPFTFIDWRKAKEAKL
jgi:hypothetical protein